MKRTLHLDLEDTIITSWGDGVNAGLLNVGKIGRYIKIFQPDEIKVFSYAVWDDNDVGEFERVFKSRIERALDCKIVMDDFFTVKRLEEEAKRRMGYIFESRHEAMIFFGKDYGFQWWVSKIIGEGHHTLIDDVVESKRITFKNRDLVIVIERANELL